MEYRPEYRLDQLRLRFLHCAPSPTETSTERQEEQPPPMLLLLPWLRTMVVDLDHTPAIALDERVKRQQRTAFGCAVDSIVGKGLSEEHLSELLPFVTQRMLRLTTLDLRSDMCLDCSWRKADDFFLAVANAHSLSLRRLYLPPYCQVDQSTLDRFTQLEELDACGCEKLTSVDFCSATLRVLYANECINLTDEGLHNATRLEVLHVRGCENVSDVSSFAHCLLSLNASFGCRIGSAALRNCRRLQVLFADGNELITTLQPFSQRLRELDVGPEFDATMNGAALAEVRGLVKLSVCDVNSITTVEPFGSTLRRLNAACSKIGDAGLVSATNLVYLNAMYSPITSVAPFGSSLLELRTGSGIDDGALSAATNLMWLDLSSHSSITTVHECRQSLRHLVAGGRECGMTNEGVSTATKLVTLSSRGNRNLTTIEPFHHCLEELTTDIEDLLTEVQSVYGFVKSGSSVWLRTAQ